MGGCTGARPGLCKAAPRHSAGRPWLQLAPMRASRLGWPAVAPSADLPSCSGSADRPPSGPRLSARVPARSDEEVRELHPAHTQASIRALLPRLRYFEQGTCIVHHLFGGEVCELVRQVGRGGRRTGKPPDPLLMAPALPALRSRAQAQAVLLHAAAPISPR